jgi:DNA-directed RNA polymerase
MIEKQIELEQKMTQLSIDAYRLELEKAKQKDTFSNTPAATKIISRILDVFVKAINDYKDDYSKGKAVRSTMAADVISRLEADRVAFITAKIILNKVNSIVPVQQIYKSIGQALEDEFKMREFKAENSHYYKAIQEDLNRRGAKANRKKNITTGVFNKKLDFHLERWTVTEKFQTGLILIRLFVESTGLVEFVDSYKGKKHIKNIVPSPELVTWIENMNEKLEVMQPFFLPMVCKPKEWTSLFDGGYISPYLKKNKFIKNNSRDYLKKLETATMPKVYEAVNHLQNTAWQINNRVLAVAKELWEIGHQVAEMPDREDESLIPYPFPDKDSKEDAYTEEEQEVIKKWKRETYEIHKRNVQKRSLRILTSQILRIANDFNEYEKIYFPHQMDFRGRVYPIPVLLQPQGSDLSKGLLHFAEGKRVDDNSIRWLQIHGANVYGYDKECYDKRVQWTLERHTEIKSYAENPLDNRGWTEADKPFQFLAFCFEYSDYLNSPEDFTTHIPIQLDGTCNGLQHYSALLRDVNGGKAVNLINSEKPSDIYLKIAERLEEKLKEIKNRNTIEIRNSNRNVDNDSSDLVGSTRNTSSNSLLNFQSVATRWLDLGINRKLTKRPVMVLPYGGTMISCREYIGEYLTDNYSSQFIWEHFGVGDNPTDCIYKVSVWLSKYLWESITETLEAATKGMDYLRKLARVITGQGYYMEWLTPVGLLVRQAYQARKKKEIKTELYGSIIKTRINVDMEETLDNQRQVNGICPNFIHSLDASCLMLYLLKCKEQGIDCFITVHDCYGTLAPDTDMSAKLLREAFVEIYQKPIINDFTEDVLSIIYNEIDNTEDNKKKDKLTKLLEELPEKPEIGELNIEDVLESEYFFN